MEWETDRSLQLRMAATLGILLLLPLLFTEALSLGFEYLVARPANSLTEGEAAISRMRVDPSRVTVLLLTVAGIVLANVFGGVRALRESNAQKVPERDLQR